MISNNIGQSISVKRTSTSIMTHDIKLLNINSLQNLSFRREDKVLFSLSFDCGCLHDKLWLFHPRGSVFGGRQFLFVEY